MGFRGNLPDLQAREELLDFGGFTAGGLTVTWQ